MPNILVCASNCIWTQIALCIIYFIWPVINQQAESKEAGKTNVKKNARCQNIRQNEGTAAIILTGTGRELNPWCEWRRWINETVVRRSTTDMERMRPTAAHNYGSNSYKSCAVVPRVYADQSIAAGVAVVKLNMWRGYRNMAERSPECWLVTACAKNTWREPHRELCTSQLISNVFTGLLSVWKILHRSVATKFPEDPGSPQFRIYKYFENFLLVFSVLLSCSQDLYQQ